MSKSKSKAKRSRAKAVRIPRDPGTGQQFLFDPQTGEPTRRYRQRKPTPAEIAAERSRRVASRKRYESQRAAFRARLGRRPVEMQHDGYTLPADVAAFLQRFHHEPRFYSGEVQISVEQARRLAEAAYMDGCRQGYIEGFVVRRMPDKKRSANANAGKRRVLVTLPDGTAMTRDERDAAIVAEYPLLTTLMDAGAAQFRLAEKNGISDKQIRNILTAANKAKR